MSSASLPTPREFVTTLISSIQQQQPSAAKNTESSNTLRDASQHTQKTLLTLHVLFPNELLAALDVLDRNLVTRFILKDETSPHQEGPTTTSSGQSQVYIVRSGQAPSRFRQINHTTSYEVRLDAWSCSCPAFAFSAFPATQPGRERQSLQSDDVDQQTPHTTDADTDLAWKFGGLSLGTDVPVCKHLLACILVEHSGVFAGFVEECEVSVEELAGWAAGWGD